VVADGRLVPLLAEHEPCFADAHAHSRDGEAVAHDPRRSRKSPERATAPGSGPAPSQILTESHANGNASVPDRDRSRPGSTASP
jgi:hypothetical protein